MAKSQILKELANNEIPLDIAFNRLLIISSDISNDNLYNWCLKELNGYESSDLLPNYRKFFNSNFRYSGINGRLHVTNQPLSPAALPLDVVEKLMKQEVRQGINTLVMFANSNDSIITDLTIFAGKVLENTGLHCLSIKQVFYKSDFNLILEKVKTLLLTVFIKLDKEFGNLDSLDINSSSVSVERLQEVNAEITNFISYDNHMEEI